MADDSHSNNQSLSVGGLVCRTVAGAPMQPLEEAHVEVGGGVAEDLPPRAVKRGVTFLSRTQWDETMQVAGADLPWSARRANVLVEGTDRLEPWIGKTIQIGNDVQIEILNETKPCSVMDGLHAGLREIMEADCRGGVYGRVLVAGILRSGDAIAFIPNPTA